jgi:hypothetical protein
MPEEHLVERELPRAQLYPTAPDRGLTGTQVELRSPGVKDGCLGSPLPAEPYTHTREQLLEPERLRDVVVRATLEPR